MTSIEWTDATWNPVGGCSIESPGCGPCYAQQLAGTRLRNHPLYLGTTSLTTKLKPVFNGLMTAAPDDSPVWSWPARWRGTRDPKLGAGMPSLIFAGDMSDVFHENRQRETVDRLVAALVYSRHIGQLLTKRVGVMLNYFLALDDVPRWLRWDHPVLNKPNFDPSVASFDCVFPPRLWLGFSAERQREFNARWPAMRPLSALGFTVFVSYEPALGPLELPADFLALGRRAWVIAGGCSGREATPAHPDWFRAVRDQCADAKVPFFFKQWGEHYPEQFVERGSHGEVWRLGPDGRRNWAFDELNSKEPPQYRFVRVGKKASGRILDGREHGEFPDFPGSARYVRPALDRAS